MKEDGIAGRRQERLIDPGWYFMIVQINYWEIVLRLISIPL
jgi:hypothetical protein